MQFLAIILVSILGGIAYGILHDQVTVRVCLEYFTIGHPPLFATTSPTLLAVGWGVVATWWVALPLGFALATASRVGSAPKWPVQRVIGPLLILLASMGGLALLSGITGYFAVLHHAVPVSPWVADNIRPDRQVAFMADWWAHSASYLGGVVGGAVLCMYIWHQRTHMTKSDITSRSTVTLPSPAEE